MLEIIDYMIFVFKLLITPNGIVLFLIFLGLSAIHMFAIHRMKPILSTFVKLIIYPFMFTYGILMLVTANLLGKDTAQNVALSILLIPIFLSLLANECRK